LQVANKLYPLSSISQQIEDFAKEMLFSVTSSDVSELTDAEGSIADSQKVLMDLYFFSESSGWQINVIFVVELDMIVCISLFIFRDLMLKRFQTNNHHWVAALKMFRIIVNHAHLRVSHQIQFLRLRGACHCILLCVQRYCLFSLVYILWCCVAYVLLFDWK